MENQFNSTNEDFQFYNILTQYLKYWRWFLLSGVLCCGLAVLKIKTTPKIYKRSAALQINEESYSDIAAAFSDRNQFKAKVNVNNEIEALRSPELVQDVVRRLKLDIRYERRDGMKKIDLYTQSPVIAVFPNSNDGEYFSFQVDLLPDSTVVLSNFVQQNLKILQSIRTQLNIETSTPIGNVVITPSTNYSSGHYQTSIMVSKGSVRSTARGFAGSLRVSLSSKLNTVINLDMEDVSIQRAEDFLNTLINVYNENCLAEKNLTTLNALQFLDEKIEVAVTQLKEIEDRLEQYKRTHLITDTRQAASVYIQETSVYAGKASEVRSQITIAEFIRDHLRKNSDDSELPTNIGLNSPTVETSIREYNDLLRKRTSLMASGGGNNPLMVEINQKISSLRQSIAYSIDNQINTLNLQLSGFQQQESRAESQIASNPMQEKQLASIERELKLKQDLVTYLEQRREENQMALVMSTTNSRLISSPSGGSFPIKPNKYKILFIALMVGASIPGGIIWGRDTINIAVRGKLDLSNLPVLLLGTIPQAKMKDEKDMLLVHEQGRDAVNESFRMVRTNLDFTCMQPDMKNTKVIQFTSMELGTGKTFISVNLAMTFALAGRKVVLLDLDMRTAALSWLIEYPELGISNMLSKSVLAEHFIKKDYFYHGFDIIPVGPMPKNPSELLMGGYLKPLIEKLRNMYDYVFIDSTPAELVADAAIVGQFADLSVFILRENYTDRRKLPELRNLFHSGKFKNMRIILNGSDTEVPVGKYDAYNHKSRKQYPMLPETSHEKLFEIAGLVTEGSKTRQ